MSVPEAFIRDVKDALSNLYDPIHLQSHPLVEQLALPVGRGETAGEALRQLFWDTIKSLQPDASIPTTAPEWITYRLLWQYYVQAFTLAQTCEELGLSQRSFYRRHRQGLEAVASLLWTKHRRQQPVPAPNHAPPPQARATAEAIRLATQSRREAVNLCQVLREAQATLRPLAEQQGVRLTVHCPATLPAAYGDPALFHQIILNVLTEALRLVAEDALSLTVTARAQDSLWEVSGLSGTHASTEDLQMRNGLAVSEALLEFYGGRLWLEQGEDGSLALCFTVPAAEPVTVLVIDDDLNTIQLYRRYLQGPPYSVRAARTCEELEAHLAESRPDVILLDVLMPIEDGWKLLQRLKTTDETRDIPVIICSVLPQPQLALALGAARVLQKPINESDLLETIEQAIQQRHQP
ncbi:MAG: response regulator [Chloroflexi bacterium]|jgi:CheY-like chemotaxis protein|nr:response regulator [Chloroflexota bacterium]